MIKKCKVIFTRYTEIKTDFILITNEDIFTPCEYFYKKISEYMQNISRMFPLQKKGHKVTPSWSMLVLAGISGFG